VRDLESRVSDDHHQALKLWLRLLSCTTRVEGVIRNRLRAQFETSLARFDLLAQLERESHGLTMSELSQRLMVTGANVTGLTDQLEAEGLVRRTSHPDDRRAFVVRLTSRGRRQFHRMAAVHEEWVIELFSALGVKQKDSMYALLGDLKQHLTASHGRDGDPRAARENRGGLSRRKPKDRAKEHAA
jgi:DNA-binding MarR family transcriptional regulator